MSDSVKVACVQFACGESAASDEEQVKRNIETAGRLALEQNSFFFLSFLRGSIFVRREGMSITNLQNLLFPILLLYISKISAKRIRL